MSVAADKQFESQLENFRHESSAVAKFVYAEMAIQHAASKSRRLLNRLNDNPEFWLTCEAALQSSAYISLGRIFDTGSRFNINGLMDSMQNQLEIFQRPALSARKWNGGGTRPEWLDEYLDEAHYPNQRDVDRIRAQVQKYREIFDRAIKPPRNKYLAHREKRDRSDVQTLFGAGKISELWRLTSFLVSLEQGLWNQLYNGQKISFRQSRYSINSIFENANRSSSRPQERIVAELKAILALIESSGPQR